MERSEPSLYSDARTAQDNSLSSSRTKMSDVPLWYKTTLTLEEASAYSGIGINKIRELTNEKKCRFVLWVGTKRLIKRRLFDEFIEESYSI